MVVGCCVAAIFWVVKERADTRQHRRWHVSTAAEVEAEAEAESEALRRSAKRERKLIFFFLGLSSLCESLREREIGSEMSNRTKPKMKGVQKQDTVFGGTNKKQEKGRCVGDFLKKCLSLCEYMHLCVVCLVLRGVWEQRQLQRRSGRRKGRREV